MRLALPRRCHALDQPRGLSGQEFGRGRGDPCPRTARDLDETLLLEDEQRLAHGGAADAETLHQILLGRELAAFGEFAAGDRVFKLFSHFMSPLAASDRQSWHILHVRHPLYRVR
jgi:hypothetical protein